MANWEQLNFQDRIRPLIEQLFLLHDHIISILTLIMCLVFYIIFFFFISIKQKTLLKENHNLEIIWTLLPAATLLLIAFPSLRLLYISEENYSCPISIKIIGHQWYWSYEYTNFKEIEFDSFIQSNIPSIRLLETDNPINLPQNIFTQLFISSSDVLHSWAIPALGVKADASPGRLNIINIRISKPGLLFGQCSEICGSNHRFMPISLFITPFNEFIFWIKLQIISLKSFQH